MATNKREQFDESQTRLAELGRALAHPARVAILQTLAARNTCVCGEIAQGLPLAQSTVSQHLKVLKEIGLIRGEVDGPKSCYCIDSARLNELVQALQIFLATFSKNCTDDTQCCS